MRGIVRKPHCSMHEEEKIESGHEIDQFEPRSTFADRLSEQPVDRARQNEKDRDAARPKESPDRREACVVR